MSIKASLAAALAGFGLHKMAGKAMATPDDDDQALASSIATEMNAEVGARAEAQAADNPLLKALAEAGITTAAQIATLSANAKLGETAVAGVRKAACENAIIAYGQEEGAKEAETIAALPAGPALDRYASRLKADAEKIAPAGGKKPQTAAASHTGIARTAQDADAPKDGMTAKDVTDNYLSANYALPGAAKS